MYYNSHLFQYFKTRKDDPPLVVFTQEGMNLGEILSIMKNHEELNGYPIVVSKESQNLLGYILKRDLKLAIGKRVTLK